MWDLVGKIAMGLAAYGALSIAVLILFNWGRYRHAFGAASAITHILVAGPIYGVCLPVLAVVCVPGVFFQQLVKNGELFVGGKRNVDSGD